MGFYRKKTENIINIDKVNHTEYEMYGCGRTPPEGIKQEDFTEETDYNKALNTLKLVETSKGYILNK